MKIIHYTDMEPQALTKAGPGVSIRVVIGKADDDVNFCMRIIEVEPGAEIPFHTHDWEHQQFYHSGTGYLIKGDEKVAVGPGSVTYVAPNEKHYVKNAGDTPLVFVCLVPQSAPEI